MILKAKWLDLKKKSRKKEHNLDVQKNKFEEKMCKKIHFWKS